MKNIFDQYTLKARIQPALFTVLPLGILLFLWMPSESLATGGILGIISTGGGTALLAQIARDRGSKKQKELWCSWGGAPTTRLLRFRDSPNRTTLIRWRLKLERLMGQEMPSQEDEALDSAGADQHYEAAVSFLREITRDRSKFPLILAESVNYGFRRNLWGLKPCGLFLAVLAATASWWLFVSSLGLTPAVLWTDSAGVNADAIAITRLAGSICNTAAIVAWVLVITPEWVRSTAEAYAQRLLGSIDALG